MGFYSKTESPGNNDDDEYTAYQGAVEYALGTGVSVSSTLLYAEYDSGAGTETDGIQWINGLALSF